MLFERSLLQIFTTLHRNQSTKIGRLTLCQSIWYPAYMWSVAYGKASQVCSYARNLRSILSSSIHSHVLELFEYLHFIFWPFKLGFMAYDLKTKAQPLIFCKELLSNLQHLRSRPYPFQWQLQSQYSQIVSLAQWRAF